MTSSYTDDGIVQIQVVPEEVQRTMQSNGKVSASIEAERSKEGDVHTLSMPADLWGRVSQYLIPVDLISLRKTCSALYRVSQQRFIWLSLARNVCEEYGLFKGSFSFEKMTCAELEHLALSPSKFDELVTESSGASLPPAHVRIFTPRMEGEPMDTDTIFLVPGGRYLITRRPDVGIFLWDLGLNADTPPTLSPLAHLPIKKPFDLYPLVPTPDGQGVRIYHCHEFWADLEIVDIYPAADKPEFRTVGSIKLQDQYAPRLKAYTSTHFALVVPMESRIMVVRCPDGLGRPLMWYFLDGFDPAVRKLCGLSIFDKTLIAFHRERMFVVDLPDFDIVSHGATVKLEIDQLPSFDLPKTECPYNIYTPEWFGPVEDGRHLLGVFIAEQEEHQNRWEEYSFSDIQIFRIEPQQEKDLPAISPVKLGEILPVAGPRQTRERPSERQREFETCIRANRLQRTPTAFYFTGMVKEPKAPLLLVKYQLPDPSSMETPSSPSFVKLTDGLVKEEQWAWIQDVAVCHATGRVVVATPHGQLTGTHEFRIIDYLPPPSSRQR